MKIKPSLLPWPAIWQVADLMTRAQAKYPEPKWQTMSSSEHIDAACRHLMRHLSGEIIDGDEPFPHTVHAACRLLMAVAQQMAEDGKMNLNYMDVYGPTYDGQEKL